MFVDPSAYVVVVCDVHVMAIQELRPARVRPSEVLLLHAPSIGRARTKMGAAEALAKKIGARLALDGGKLWCDSATLALKGSR